MANLPQSVFVCERDRVVVLQAAKSERGMCLVWKRRGGMRIGLAVNSFQECHTGWELSSTLPHTPLLIPGQRGNGGVQGSRGKYEGE